MGLIGFRDRRPRIPFGLVLGGFGVILEDVSVSNSEHPYVPGVMMNMFVRTRG
jgi:hypothetical protein